jgi:hypothetical protein
MERRAPPDARCQAPRPRRYPAAIRRGNDRVSVPQYEVPNFAQNVPGVAVDDSKPFAAVDPQIVRKKGEYPEFRLESLAANNLPPRI